jgi:hypothetical protein
MKSNQLSRVISLDNAGRLPVADIGATGIKPGQIYALDNDSRFVDGNFSEPLTMFAIGYRDPNNLEATLEALAPRMPVPGRLFEWKKWANAEEYYSETDDIRAIGADFKRVEYNRADQTGKTLNKGLMMRVDLDQVVQVAGWQNTYVAKLLRRLMRNEIRRASALLAGIATDEAKTWDANADPDADVNDALILAADGSPGGDGVAAVDGLGFRPNRVVYGDTAWAIRFKSFRGNANASKWLDAKLTPAEIATLVLVDQVYISKERYQSTATAKGQIIGNKVFMFCAEPGADTEDPSSVKRFVSAPTNLISDANFQRPAGALDINVYVQQLSPKLVDIYVEHNSNIIATSTLGVRSLTVTA